MGALLLLGALLLSGCGGSSSHTVTAPRRPVRQNDFATIAVASPARMGNGVIASRYTCTGGNVSPPITWAGVNANAKEVAILVRALLGRGRFAVNWAVAGIAPTANSLSAGALPTGAVVGRNSSGQDRYSLCDTGSKLVPLFTIAVLALPHKLNLSRGFDPAILTQQLGKPGVQWGSMVAYWRNPNAPIPSGG